MEKKKLSLKEIGIEKLIIILLCGIFLIIISVPELVPSKNVKVSSQNTNSNAIDSNPLYSEKENESSKYIEELESKLQTVLRKVDGIGDVKVMITLKSSKELVTLKDIPYSQSSLEETDGEGGTRTSSEIEKKESTILVDSQEGEGTPYVIKEIEPEVQGVVIVAEGANNGIVANEIIEAVQVLFDVPIHKIKVMNMNR